MGYEHRMQADIIGLLRMFEDALPDRESHAWTAQVASDPGKWSRGREVFHRIRDRNLRASARGDRAAEAQYCFEEACLQSLFNETSTDTPFDSCAPYWIIPNALSLAAALGLGSEKVLAVVAPPK